MSRVRKEKLRNEDVEKRMNEKYERLGRCDDR